MTDAVEEPVSTLNLLTVAIRHTIVAPGTDSGGLIAVGLDFRGTTNYPSGSERTRVGRKLDHAHIIGKQTDSGRLRLSGQNRHHSNEWAHR